MSVSIKIHNIVKKYGKNTVIPGLSLEIEEGEFFTLLGPSGCGKTTLLRMIAGFNTIEGGEIYFNDQLINNVLPEKRNIGMVFQNYAIFPHLSVQKNVAFGLENRNESRDEISKKVDDILKTVKMYEYKERMPEKLSGGQQQRIALARAIVIRPNVLLMDEPLSNLDAKLRVEMRNVIRDIQRDVGITTIYVTHDQEEAMAVSDRIAVMNRGVIEHVGRPQDIYHRPSNVFVANFIGHTNIVYGKLILNQDKAKLVLSKDYSIEMDNLDTSHMIEREADVKVSIRPDEFVINKEGLGLKGVILNNIFLGSDTHYSVKLETGEKIEIVQESSLGDNFNPGMEINLTVKEEKINVFHKESEENITKGVAAYVS